MLHGVEMLWAGRHWLLRSAGLAEARGVKGSMREALARAPGVGNDCPASHIMRVKRGLARVQSRDCVVTMVLWRGPLARH